MPDVVTSGDLSGDLAGELTEGTGGALPTGLSAVLGAARRLGARPGVVRPAFIYLVSRAVTTVVMSVVATASHQSFLAVVDRWDSRWFVRAAAQGWPSTLPMTHGHVAGNTIAFFPLFPLSFRALSDITGASLLATGTTLSILTGLTASMAVWALVRRYAGPGGADRATLLLVVCPGSFAFSLVYAEGMVITLVALGLLALDSRRWVLAGLAGLLASAAAPIALAFAVGAGWAAWAAIRERRAWGAVAAPLLAPGGFVLYQLWLWHHTGNLMAWRLTEQGGWKSYFSPLYPLRLAWRFVAHPLGGTLTQNILLCGTVVFVACAVVAIRSHQPGPILLTGLVAGALALMTVPVGPRPRFLLDAFPLVLAVGVRAEGRAYTWIAAASAALLVVFTALEAASWAVFP